MEILQLKLPLTISIPRKTKADVKKSLNMNTYRNLYHHENNQMKVLFKQILAEMLGNNITPIEVPVRLTYTLFQKTNRNTDVANVLSIVDKFTCDALVELGMIADDNHKYIPEIVFLYGGVDKENPRAELIVTVL